MLSSLSRSDQFTQPPPILNCPYNVLSIIFAYADIYTLRSLNATCQVISEAVTPLVYRHITLYDNESPEDPLASRFITPNHGRFVHSCKIRIIHPWNKPRLTLIFFISAL